MIDEPPAIYGIIGNPLNHTLSPLMHNAAFKALKVNAVYKPFSIEEDELKLFFEDLKEENNPIFGLNVTVPYKEKVLGYMDGMNTFAEKVGAINTIVINRQRKLFGYNTDGPGFLSHLLELGFDPKDKHVAIMGAGGTTRAILCVLCLLQDRPMQIKLYNRSKENALNLIKDIASRVDTSIIDVVDDVEDLNIEITDLLVNTTTVGMKKNDPLMIDPNLLHANLLVYDVIYAPKETPLLVEAKQRGAKTANGLGMLFFQGVLAFQHWADCQIDDKLKKVMRKALEDKAHG